MALLVREATSSTARAVGSFREAVQDLLVPELRAMKVSIDSLTQEMRLRNEQVTQELRMRTDQLQQEMRMRDTNQREELRVRDEQQKTAIAAMSDRFLRRSSCFPTSLTQLSTSVNA